MNFNKDYFKANQKKLVWIANKWYLRWLLGLNRLPKDLKEKKILQITPNSISYDYKDGKITTAFFTRPRFAEALAFNLSPFAYLKNQSQTKWQWRFSPVGAMALILMALSGHPIFLGTTDTYYSGAGDGEVQGAGNGGTLTENWDNAHDATTGAADYTTNPVIGPLVQVKDDATYIRRGFVPIDTSGLPDTATISSASLNLYITATTDNDNDGNDFIGVVQTTQASTSSLIGDDYDNCGAVNSPTEGATRVDITNITVSAYNTWTLNSTGLTWISLTGYTKLGLREGHDILDDPVPSGGSVYNKNEIDFYTSEQTGTTQDPYLSVTYSTTVDYTMVADLGSYTLTGISAIFQKTLNIVLSVGNYVLTGIDALLKRGYGIIANTGSYALTGVSISFKKALNLALSAGSYVLTGIAVTLRTGAGIVFSTLKTVLTFKSFSIGGLRNKTKNSTTLTNTSKNSATMTNTTKNSTTLTNLNK